MKVRDFYIRLIDKLYHLYSALYNRLANHYKRIKWRNSIKEAGNYRGTLTRDQYREAKAYWSQYSRHFSPLWHEFFTAKTGVFDVRYVPEDIQFVELEPKINNMKSDYGIDDKNNYKMYFPEIRHPKSVFRKSRGIYHDDDYNIITEEQAIQNCIECGDVILKPPKLYGIGCGIRFWKADEGVEVLKSIIASMGDNINAQEYIHQHIDMARMNPSSCNTIRVMTYANCKEISVICAYYQVGMNKDARMGQVSTGGVCVSINQDGTLAEKGYDLQYNAYDRHTSGIKFAGYRIPSFERVCDMAKKLHRKMGDFGLISWDFTVDTDGTPIFIEMNLHWGGIVFHQLSGGPLYGQNTDQILKEILG